MGLSRALTISILLLALLMISASSTPIVITIERDPPSVFNVGAGGISGYIFDLIASGRRVEVIYSLSDISKYNPERHVVIIMGPDKRLDNIDSLTEWVKKGGVSILMDEYDLGIDSLTNLGISRGNLYPSIVTVRCILGSINITLFLNVFADLRTSDQWNVVCKYNGVPVAAVLYHGRGYIVVVGDSSLVINEIRGKAQDQYHVNVYFIELLAGGRDIVIYEGAREFSYIESHIIAYAISIIVSAISKAFHVIYEGGITTEAILVLILSSICIVVTVSKFGLPRPIVMRVHKEKSYAGYSLSSLNIKVNEGLSQWIKAVGGRDAGH